MSGESQEKAFLERMSEALPELRGYSEPADRKDTDERLRDYLAGCLDGLVERVGEIRQVADEEGDVDMVDDLDRIAERFGRTAKALREADYGACAFFAQERAPREQIASLCAYDSAILDDLELLTNDMGALKYETIGTLTLREVEGTLASIELRVANRRDILGRSES